MTQNPKLRKVDKENSMSAQYNDFEQNTSVFVNNLPKEFQ